MDIQTIDESFFLNKMKDTLYICGKIGITKAISGLITVLLVPKGKYILLSHYKSSNS
jgi:hypothetical protein